MADSEQKEKWVPGCRLITTDEVGLVKGVEARGVRDWGGARIVSRWGDLDRHRSIGAMHLSSRGGFSDTGSATAVVTRGAVGFEVLNPLTGLVLGKVGKRVGADKKPDRVTGVSSVWEGACLASHDMAVLSCSESGRMRLHAPSEDSEGAEWEEVSGWDAAQNCECLALSGSMELAAIGGQGNELAVWDLATQKRAFLAKGAKKDFLGLQDKPWVSALGWMPGKDNRKVVVGTGSSKLRLYDLSTSMRRPVMEASFEKQTRVSCVAPGKDGASVWAANGLGIIQQWDLTAGRMGGVLKGPGGAVRSLALHPEEDVIASVGLDRYLRVHDCSTRKQLGRVYLKQQMTGVAWCPLEAAVAEPEANGAPEQEVEAAGKAPGKKRSKSKGAGGKEKRAKKGREHVESDD